jgi:hypothetical protein
MREGEIYASHLTTIRWGDKNPKIGFIGEESQERRV